MDWVAKIFHTWSLTYNRSGDVRPSCTEQEVMSCSWNTALLPSHCTWRQPGPSSSWGRCSAQTGFRNRDGFWLDLVVWALFLSTFFQKTNEERDLITLVWDTGQEYLRLWGPPGPDGLRARCPGSPIVSLWGVCLQLIA